LRMLSNLSGRASEKRSEAERAGRSSWVDFFREERREGERERIQERGRREREREDRGERDKIKEREDRGEGRYRREMIEDREECVCE